MVLTHQGLNDVNNIANIYCVICGLCRAPHIMLIKTPRWCCHCDKSKWCNHILPREVKMRQYDNIRINLGISLWVRMYFVLSFYLVTVIKVAGQDCFSFALRIQGSETQPPWIPLEQCTNGKERSPRVALAVLFAAPLIKSADRLIWCQMGCHSQGQVTEDAVMGPGLPLLPSGQKQLPSSGLKSI